MSNNAQTNIGAAVSAAKTFTNRRATAGNPATPAETLASLAKDRSKVVRRYVAGNPSTPAETLESLAKDRDVGVQFSVAGNPSTPAETLAVLAGLTGEYHTNVRQAVAWNSNTPAAALTLLAKDERDYVRCAVAGNPSTSPNLLAELANDKHLCVRWEAAKTYTIDNGTSAEAKAEILRAVLAGPERVVAIKAAAGTGKGHLLLSLASQPGVQIYAPTTAIARGLAANGIKALTSDDLLSDPNSPVEVKALVVDESSALAVLWRNRGSNEEFWRGSGNEIMNNLMYLDRQLRALAEIAEHAQLILFS